MSESPLTNALASKPNRESSIAGVILAGGRSQRMGRDKSLLTDSLQQTLVTRVGKVLSQVVQPVVIVRSFHAPKMSATGPWREIKDERNGCGPLEGIRAALKSLEHESEAAMVACCDSPLLKPELIAELCRIWLEVRSSQNAVIPVALPRVYGLTGVYRTSLHVEIEQQIERNELRVRDFVQCCNAFQIPVEQLKPFDPKLESFANINTPEDYQRFLKSEST